VATAPAHILKSCQWLERGVSALFIATSFEIGSL
jgi:hypothetical protein